MPDCAHGWGENEAGARAGEDTDDEDEVPVGSAETEQDNGKDEEK
jgi:hypothetical protein